MGTAQTASVDVTLTPDSTQPNGIKFDMQSSLKNGDELRFRNPKKGDWFEVEFNIVDSSNTGYLFPDDETKAMYVRTVNNIHEPCPDDWNKPEYWSQFEAQEVKNANRTLRVKNLNQDIQLFKFCLWFTKTPKNNGPCIPYDPIGSNQDGGDGGGILQFEFSPMQIVGVAVLVVLVALLSFAMWAR